jgi:hypothetical protein
MHLLLPLEPTLPPPPSLLQEEKEEEEEEDPIAMAPLPSSAMGVFNPMTVRASSLAENNAGIVVAIAATPTTLARGGQRRGSSAVPS